MSNIRIQGKAGWGGAIFIGKTLFGINTNWLRGRTKIRGKTTKFNELLAIPDATGISTFKVPGPFDLKVQVTESAGVFMVSFFVVTDVGNQVVQSTTFKRDIGDKPITFKLEVLNAKVAGTIKYEA